MATGLDTELYQDFLPYFKVMKLFGLHHSKKNISSALICDKKRRCSQMTFSQCYSLIVIFLFICNDIRLLTMFESRDHFGYHLFMKILLVTYYFYGASNFVTSYAACSGLPQFFMQWKEFQHNFKTNGTNRMGAK